MIGYAAFTLLTIAVIVVGILAVLRELKRGIERGQEHEVEVSVRPRELRIRRRVGSTDGADAPRRRP